MASGQHVPHQQAAHMAAPTEGQNIKIPLPTESRPHMAQSGHFDEQKGRTGAALLQLWVVYPSDGEPTRAKLGR